MEKLIKVCTALVIAALVSTHAVAEDQLFYIEGDAPAGTKFKTKDAVSPVPFDKSYAELTPRQKDLFKMNYGELPADQVPPFPAQGLQDIYLPILKGHRKMPRDGEVYAIAVVGSSGKVVKVDVYKAPNKPMANLVSAVLFDTEFDAASCSGKPCAMEFLLEMKLSAEFR